MATKKTTAKAKPAVKKAPAKKVVKKTNTKVVKKTEKKSTGEKPENMSILRSNVSVVIAMAIEALILLLGYLIIMSV